MGSWEGGTCDEKGKWIPTHDDHSIQADFGSMSCYSYWLDRMMNLVRKLDHNPLNPSSKNFDEIVKNKAFVQLHLTSLLLGCSAREDVGLFAGPELIEDLIRIGDCAFKTLPPHVHAGFIESLKAFETNLFKQGIDINEYFKDTSIREVDSTVKQRQKSVSAVASIFYSEASSHSYRNRQFQQALEYFAKSAGLFDGALDLSIEIAIDKQFNLQEAAICFESLSVPGASVQSWTDIAEWCQLIHESLDADIDDLKRDTKIEALGSIWEASDYWQRACTLAETKMLPDEYNRAQDDREKTKHLTRLKRDFFENSWDLLEKESRRQLISVELAWYDAFDQGGRVEAALNELRLVFETELDALIFGDKQIKQFVKGCLSDREKRDIFQLSSKNSNGKTGLNNMAKLLKEAGNRKSFHAVPLQQFINVNFTIDATQKDFLYKDLPPYIERLNATRTGPEHHDPAPPEEIATLRRKALGIGEPSHLLRLLEIKKARRIRESI